MSKNSDAIVSIEATPSQRKTAGQALKGGAKKTGQAVGSVLKDFVEFLKRGNVVDLAVGIVMGAAFTAVVTSVVNDLITPVIGLATQTNLENAFIVIKCKPDPINGTIDGRCVEGKQGGYTTIAIANASGAITWNWGRFVQTVINFIMISLIVFLMLKAYTAAFLRKKAAVTTRSCSFCTEEISIEATRCKFCTSVQDVDKED
ncbi:hypothetical protein HDU97_003654 [Phlyctochytrium planicorne]|nr:hypothetical protein HDU97_003654 [Phlyctochytrium planicorne]